MTLVLVTIVLPCRDDVPAHVVQWMADNLAEHAAQEFDSAYEPEFGRGYDGPPLVGPVSSVVVEEARGDRAVS
jgi:hypothetical protein